MKTCRLFQVMVLLCLFTLLVGCSSDDSENGVLKPIASGPSVSEPTDMVEAVTPTIFPEVSTEALFANLGYETLFTNDDKLWYATNEMSQPELIADSVHPASLALAPDYSTLIFGVKVTDVELERFGILNLATQEIISVEFPEVTLPVVRGWSPDGKWVVLSFSNNRQVIILDLSTGDYTNLNWYSEDEQPRTLSIYWLTDSRLLVYARRDAIRQASEGQYGAVVTDVYIIDPMTGERDSIDLSVEAMRVLELRFSPATLNTLDTELQNQGLNLAIPYMPLGKFAYFPEMAGAAAVDIPEQASDLQTPPCDVWSIRYTPIREASLPQQLYRVENVTFLSNLTLLPDESLLVAQWKSATCNLFDPENLTAQLLHVKTDGVINVIATDISYGSIFSFNALIYDYLPAYARSNMYAVSPDGQHVAWVRPDDATTSSIVVSDLQTMQSTTLFELNHGDTITSVIMFQTLKP